jgi:acetolactate synthase I/II/III large subunit
MTGSADPPKGAIDRRRFIKSATTMAGGVAAAYVQARESLEPSDASAASPSHSPQSAQERQSLPDYSAEERKRYFVDRPGSDFMVDALKHLGIEHFAINPGASFRGLHESVVNYGGNERPNVISCQHEEQAVALAHGYAKAAGKPMAVACHGTVGLQHGAMAIYNAWCDRAPVLLIAGNHNDVKERTSSVTWVHSAQDVAAMVRDFTKWDDQPHSLEHFGESLMRAHHLATTVPMGPTLIVVDAGLQESPMLESPPLLPALGKPSFPSGRHGSDKGGRTAACERLLSRDRGRLHGARSERRRRTGKARREFAGAGYR